MKVNKKFQLILPLLCLLLFLSGCGGGGKSKKPGDVDVYLGGEVIEKDDMIVVEGKSNLLEGARVTGEVLVNEDEKFSDTTELVDKKGNFTMEMEHPEYGEAEVVVTFDFKGMQEEEIIEQYGEGGEKLEGPFVYLTDHYDVDDIERKAEMRLSLKEDDEEKKHEFTEPEWDKRPKDYGDSRVWMEIEEVTDDGEYFYITGKSNLLEGSQIRVNHAHSADTRVNPDGSFAFTLEYKYEEDRPIVIQFNPSNQWGSIAAHYGEHGEKLVGNLVKQEGNYLQLEYAYEYD